MSGLPVTVVGCVQADLLLAPVDDLPAPGSAAFIEDIGMRPGGAGANVAFAFAEVGAPVRLIGCVGDDHLGRWMLEELAAAGLEADIVTVPDEPTGMTVVCEGPRRDRTFITHLGVNATWELSMIPADALAASSVLLCDYFCAPRLQGLAALELLRGAQEAGARTFFDTSWDPNGWSRATKEEVRALLAHVDVFLPNEAEAGALAGGSGPIEESARALQSVSGGWVVVKLGSRGCLAVGPDGEVLSAPAPEIEVVDSTGAGDAFNAGLMAALGEEKPWPEALDAATNLASTIVSRPAAERVRASR